MKSIYIQALICLTIGVAMWLRDRYRENAKARRSLKWIVPVNAPRYREADYALGVLPPVGIAMMLREKKRVEGGAK